MKAGGFGTKPTVPVAPILPSSQEKLLQAPDDPFAAPAGFWKLKRLLEMGISLEGRGVAAVGQVEPEGFVREVRQWVADVGNALQPWSDYERQFSAEATSEVAWDDLRARLPILVAIMGRLLDRYRDPP